MKLRLVNFLCYDDKTFEFGNEGMVLLSGPSGKGKTSILRGIFFALFGEGNKLQNNGKTSCRVELDFDKLKIIRTKRPNRLVINDIYEDDTAQEIINKMFGKTFKTSGYIQQNNLSSFILMSPIEKLSFLEKFAFNDINLIDIKKRCKSYISKKSDEHLVSISQLNMALNILKNMTQPTKILFPIKCKKSQTEKVTKNESIKYKNCIILSKRLEKQNKALSKELTDIKILNTKIEEKNNQINSIQKQIKNNEIEQEKYDYKGDEWLEGLNSMLKTLLKTKKLVLLKKTYEKDKQKLDQMYKNEKLSLVNELSTIKENLWKLYTEEDLIETLDNLNNCLYDAKKLKKLKIELNNYSENIFELLEKNNDKLSKNILELDNNRYKLEKLKLQQKTYTCPNCECIMYIKNEKLHIIKEKILTDNILNEIEQIEIKIHNLEHNIEVLKNIINNQKNDINYKNKILKEIESINNSYDEELPDILLIKKDLKFLHEYKAEHTELEKKKNMLENFISTDNFSSSYKSFRNNCKQLEIKIKKYEENYTENYKEDYTENQLRQNITTQTNYYNKTQYLSDKNQKINKQIKKIHEDIEIMSIVHKKIYKDINNYKKIEKNIEENDRKISDKNKSKNIHQENLKKIDNWQRYKQELQNYNNLEKKIKELEKIEKEKRLQHSASLILKNKILESESISMINIIESINTHAHIYLEHFFPENPISVQLQSFKEIKKVRKPCINIIIDYKGMECDLNMLSGGELSRVVLAYTLSLSEIFNTPLIMLDECTSSLDEELTSVVFEGIKEHFKGKIILMIAHQVISGTFDNIIRL